MRRGQESQRLRSLSCVRAHLFLRLLNFLRLAGTMGYLNQIRFRDFLNDALDQASQGRGPD